MGRLSESNYSFSHSEMSTFKRCKRKWYLHYFRGLRRRRDPMSKARDTGILVHAALHNFYVAGGLDGPNAEKLLQQFLMNARDEDMLKVETEDERKVITDVHDTSLIICNGYLEWLHETGNDMEYVFDHTEQELRAPGPVEGTEIMGIIDLGGTHAMSGDLFVMDTKVTNSFDTMLKTLHLMEQGPMYAVLAKILEPDDKRGFRVVWNMLKRNKHSGTAKPPFYQRYELAINTDQLRQFYLQLHGQITEILRLEQRLNEGDSHIAAAYPTPTQDCAWECPFFAVCGAMNDVTRNDVDFLIAAYYSTPEEREATKIEEEKEGRLNAPIDITEMR